MCDMFRKMKGGKLKMEGCCYAYGGYSGRNFLTKDEKIEMLKEYKELLDKESKGVSERIEKLNGE